MQVDTHDIPRPQRRPGRSRVRVPRQDERVVSHRAYRKTELKARKTRYAKPWSPPRRTRRQRKRSAWLAGHTQECRVGTETLIGDGMLLERVKRKPPTWLIEKYVEAEGGGVEKVYLQLLKGDPNPKLLHGSRVQRLRELRWVLAGKGYLSMHPTRAAALRTAQEIEPVLGEEVEDDDAEAIL